MSDYFRQWAELLPVLLPGMWITLQLTVFALLTGLPLVETIRGAPALILLYLVYYGLPQFSVTLTSLPSTVIAMALITGAYSSEIFRAGLQAVHLGQKEASQALGLSAFDEFRLVVLPQAVRIVTPPLVGLAIIVYQGTSLAYAVSVPELLSRAYNVGTISFNFLPPLTLAGFMYALVSLAGVALLRARWPSRRLKSDSQATPAIEPG